MHLTATKANFKEALTISQKPDDLMGKPHHFKLIIEQARGLMDCPNKDVQIEYSYSNEEGKRKTPKAKGKKFDPKFGEEHNFTLSAVTEQELVYLCKDAICFEAHHRP